MDESVVIEFYVSGTEEFYDLLVPLDITVLDLLEGLNQTFQMNLTEEEQRNSFLKAKNPLRILRGTTTLREYGITNGSIIVGR